MHLFWLFNIFLSAIGLGLFLRKKSIKSIHHRLYHTSENPQDISA